MMTNTNNSNVAFDRSKSFRVFAKDMMRSEDSRTTGLNNNVLVIGISGCSKTGSYVLPNMFSTRGSIVVADTKGQLYRNYADDLRKLGYVTQLIDFVHPERSMGYNPLDGIERYKKRGKEVINPGVYEDGEELISPEVEDYEYETYRQQDVMSIARLIVPEADEKEPFWTDSARVVIASLISYVLEVLPGEEQNFGSVAKLFRLMCKEIEQTKRDEVPEVSFFKALEDENPDSFAVKKYHMYAFNFKAEKCWSSIAQFVANALNVFDYEENNHMLCHSEVDIMDLGRRRTALFVNISDTDRSMDSIVNIFYTQLYQILCRRADDRADGRLKVPVHIILDDFAANVYIPDFDKIISVIRSRDISTSVILQSLSQLEAMYNKGQASTIINNCDTMVYMGGQDVETAKFFADKAGRLPERILELDLNHEWVFTRGQKACLAEKIKPYSVGPEDFQV